MATKAQTRMTLDEFLALPETKPYHEFVHGEVIEKPMPNGDHAMLVAELLRLLGNYLAETREGRVLTAVRHKNDAEEWVYLPDINVARGKRTSPRGSIRPIDDVTEPVIDALNCEPSTAAPLSRYVR